MRLNVLSPGLASSGVQSDTTSTDYETLVIAAGADEVSSDPSSIKSSNEGSTSSATSSSPTSPIQTAKITSLTPNKETLIHVSPKVPDLTFRTSNVDVKEVSSEFSTKKHSVGAIPDTTQLNLQTPATLLHDCAIVSPSIVSNPTGCEFSRNNINAIKQDEIPSKPRGNLGKNTDAYSTKPPSRHLSPKTPFPKADPAAEVQIGFGAFARQPAYAVLTECCKFYPPLSNAAYGLTTYDTPKPNHPREPAFDGASFVKTHIATQKALDAARAAAEKDPAGPSIGECLAATIDWDRVIYPGGDPTSIAIFAGSRKTYIETVDAAVAVGQDPFMFCNTCKSRHIAWGAPVTIGDRDTCLSMLPEWFPAENFPNPWDAFVDMVNRSVSIEEEAAREGKEVWDKEYHEDSRAWRAVGRRGGWWKCRTGRENVEGAEVPDVEKRCELCHGERKREERQRAQEAEREEASVGQKREWERRYIEKHMKRVMEKDKEIVRARIKAEGY